jgi:Uma2 family endonuclease
MFSPYDYDPEMWKPMIPTIFVVFGIEKKDRHYYNMEEEKKPPDVVIELISRETYYDDIGGKWYVYAQHGVHEYFTFDPLQQTRPPHLRGFRLERGAEEYVRLPDTDRLRSELLGLDLVFEEGRLRLYNTKTGERLRTHLESEAEVVRLHKELARLQNAKR